MNIDPVEVAVISASVFVSYLLGIALLQIPMRRVHKFAIDLIYDSGVVALFLAAIPAIPMLIGVALMILTGGKTATVQSQYDALNCWLGHSDCKSADMILMQDLFTTSMFIVQVLGVMPVVGKALISSWTSYTEISLSLLAAVNILRWLLYEVGVLLLNTWWALIGVGAVFYGLPAKVGRKIGGGLVAVVLVLYVGLPFMPVFVGAICAPGNVWCAPPVTLHDPNLDATMSRVKTYNESLSKIVQMQEYLLSNPDVDFKFTDGNGKPLAAPVLVTVVNTTAIEAGPPGNQTQWQWQLWTAADGTRQYAFLPGSYTVTDVEYLNISISSPLFSKSPPQPINFTIPQFTIVHGSSGLVAVTSDNKPLQTVSVSGRLDKAYSFTLSYKEPKANNITQVPAFVVKQLGSSGQQSGLYNVTGVQVAYPIGSNADENEVAITIGGGMWGNTTYGPTQTLYLFLVNGSSIVYPVTANGQVAITVSGQTVREQLGLMYSISMHSDCVGDIPGLLPTGSPYTGPYCPAPPGGSYTVKIDAVSGPFPDYSNNIDVDPALKSLTGAMENITFDLAADGYLINKITVSLIIRRLILPAIYIMILMAVAADVSSFIGGRAISIPGVG